MLLFVVSTLTAGTSGAAVARAERRAARLAELTSRPVAEPLPSEGAAEGGVKEILAGMVGRCTLTPPDPYLKGDWLQTLTFEHQCWFQNVPCKIQPASLQHGSREHDAPMKKYTSMHNISAREQSAFGTAFYLYLHYGERVCAALLASSWRKYAVDTV